MAEAFNLFLFFLNSAQAYLPVAEAFNLFLFFFNSAQAYLPVAEAFDFHQDLRKLTHGQVWLFPLCFLVFSLDT